MEDISAWDQDMQSLLDALQESWHAFVDKSLEKEIHFCRYPDVQLSTIKRQLYYTLINMPGSIFRDRPARNLSPSAGRRGWLVAYPESTAPGRSHDRKPLSDEG